MADGMLVGYVPVIEGSEDFDESQVVDAIVRTDYDAPVATRARDGAAAGSVAAPRGRGVPAFPGRFPVSLTRWYGAHVQEPGWGKRSEGIRTHVRLPSCPPQPSNRRNPLPRKGFRHSLMRWTRSLTRVAATRSSDRRRRWMWRSD